MKIEGINLRWLKDQCDMRGFDLRTDYSGRGMYGKTCIGIVAGGHQMGIAQLLIVAALDLEAEGMNWDDALYGFDEGPLPSSDSMGLETIYYWTGVQAGDE